MIQDHDIEEFVKRYADKTGKCLECHNLIQTDEPYYITLPNFSVDTIWVCKECYDKAIGYRKDNYA